MSAASPEATHYDIAIVGAGMVGISLALLLAQQQRWRVLLVESQSLEGSDGPSYSPSFDARSTALSWSSQKIFQALGLWPQLRRHASAIAQIHVSDRGHFGLTRLEAEQAGVDALGYVIENSWLGAVLMAATADTEIDLQGHTEVADIKPLAESMQLTLKDTNQQTDSPIEVNTKLLIVADGAASSCGQQLGIHRHSKSYGQSAIIANISLSSPHGGVAYERFTDQGPMALLPLSDYQNRPRSALVWTQPTESAQHLLNADKDAFLVDLQQRFGQRMGRFNDVGERVAYPLTLSTSEEQVRRRLVVIGNAAHSLHPVAGQGFNLSLRDISVLAKTLADCPQDADIGDLKHLQNYQQQQAADQRNTLLFTDGLPKLFGLSSPLAALGRNSGLLLMDLLPSLRNQFAQFGMGLANPWASYSSDRHSSNDYTGGKYG